MMVLWTERSAADATKARSQGQWNASRVEIDSRKAQAGDLFVAIKGERVDGHAYVADALKKGAVAALVDHVPAGLEKAPLLVVKDTLKGLEDLGKYARQRASAKVVGVTGSVGKTSAKEMLRIALAAQGKTFATSGNYNNHIGTPLNLANMPPDTEFAVFEMGMNHAGEIAHLTKMVRPDVAAITNVEAVHLEFFTGLEAIADAKAEIFEGVAAGGAAVLNRDNPYYDRLAAAAAKHGITRIIGFGEQAADCRLAAYRPTADGCAIDAVIAGKPLHYTLQAAGKHWGVSSLLALACVQVLGLDVAKSATALAGFVEPEGRGRAVQIGGITLIDDSYNASPASMRSAFAKAAEIRQRQKSGRLLAALGNMLELGEGAPTLHAELAEALQQYGFDGVFTAGDLMKHLHDTLPATLRMHHMASAVELLPLVKQSLKSGDVLLVKGSHGSKMYELAAALQHVRDNAV